ncbi:exopolyphosphatase [Marinococcus halophilus]|uniref:Exopolyphosphatase n=2 Tax=Marinococcus halophilus TaxID=1371 RepID=A0A510Y5T8_MARHA|nr:exopolyphosphatase [Marinococcus halophilus]
MMHMFQAKEKVAVIDIGSNSIRLVINEVDEKRGYRELHNLKTVARLSNHIDDQDALTAEGRDILLHTLQQFEEVLRFHDVQTIHAVATAAVRGASNREEILQYIEERIDFPIRVLSGEEEASYGYLAVVNSTSLSEGITIDIGGGSTEVTMFKNRELVRTHSFPFGALTLKQKFLPNDDKITSSNLKQMNKWIEKQFQKVPWLKKEGENLPVVGIGGSSRNMVLVHQASINYPLAGLHQYSMSGRDIAETMDLLEKSSLSERENIEGLSKDRADVIIPAVRIISQLYNHIDAPSYLISNKGLRDGLLFEELLRDKTYPHFPDVIEESFYQLNREFEINPDYVDEVGNIASSMYNSLEPYIPKSYLHEDNHRLLNRAAQVLYIGEYISSEASSQHTFYILTNRSIDGIMHEERIAMSLVSSFKSKSMFKEFAKPFRPYLQKNSLKRLEFLGSILKFSYSLNRTRRNIVSGLGIDKEGKELHFHIYCREGMHSAFEEAKADKYKKHLEKMISRDVVLHFHEQSPVSAFSS